MGMFDSYAAAAQSRVDNVNPLLREQGLAGMLAENLRRQGGAGNEMAARQMEQDAGAGLGAYQVQGARASLDAESMQRRAAGAKSLAEAGKIEMLTALIENAGGVSGAGGGGGGLGVGNDRALMRAFAIGSEDPTKLQEWSDRKGHNFTRTALTSNRLRMQARMEPYWEVEAQMHTTRTLDPEDPLAVLQMINMWTKQVDKRGVVREGDIHMVGGATASDAEVFAANITRLIKIHGTVPGGQGVNIKASLLAMLAESEDAMLRIDDDQKLFAKTNAWTQKDKNLGFANQAAVGRARKRASERALWEDVGGTLMKRMDDNLFYTSKELKDPKNKGLKPWSGE